MRRWLAVLALVCAGWTRSFAADAPKLPPLTTVSGSPWLPGTLTPAKAEPKK